MAMLSVVLMGCSGDSDLSSTSSTSSIPSNTICATSEANCREAANNDASACFFIDGTTAEMYGVINSTIVAVVSLLLSCEPAVTNIVLMDVSSSTDDEQNLPAARLIYINGINTELKAESVIASGGVDYFFAGINRVIATGAQVGVHSWANGDGQQGSLLPTNDRQHDSYINYYTEIGMVDPSGFYFFTINAAASNSIHNMTEEEITFYNLKR